MQTVRHRDYFLPAANAGVEEHARPPTGREAIMSFGLLLVSLVAVVGLAKILSPAIERVVAQAGAPKGADPSQAKRRMVGAAGIEPATTCSQSRYATAALRPGPWDYPTR